MTDATSVRVRTSFRRAAFLVLTTLATLATLPMALLARPAPKPGKPAAEPTPAAKRKALLAASPGTLPEAVETRVRRLEVAWSRAQAMGLLKGPEWQESVREGRQQLLEKAYLDGRPGHPGMTEEQVRAAFLAQGDQRRVSHLLCATEAEATAALKRLQAGEAFDQVAAEVSKDLSAAVNRGDLGWVRQKELVAAFSTPVFAGTIGDLVGPIKTEFGWHVAKTREVRSPQLDDFQAHREALLKQAADAQLAVKRDRALADLRKRYPLKPDLSVLGADRTTEPLPGDEARVAGKVAGATISLKALKRHLAEVLKTMGQSHSLGAATKAQFMEGLADPIRLAAAAQKEGLDRRPETSSALWVDERERAYTAFSRTFLAGLEVPEADLQRVYTTYPDRFRPVGTLRLQVLVADSKDRVDEALNRIRVGLAWRTAVESYGSAEATGDPEPGWVEVESLRRLVPPSLLQPMLAGPLGQPLGPMLGPDGFMLFNVLERRPGPVPPLAECRDAVRADYLKEKGRILVEQELDGVLAHPHTNRRSRR